MTLPKLLRLTLVVTAIQAAACTGTVTGPSEPDGNEHETPVSSAYRRSFSSAFRSAWLTGTYRSYFSLQPAPSTTTSTTTTTTTTTAPASAPVQPVTSEPTVAPEPAAPSPAPEPTAPAPDASGTTSADGTSAASGPSFPGGFIEPTTSTQVRSRLTAAQLQALLPPAGGKFVFPAPYNTEAIRLTDSNSCGGRDCVRYVGYSYWRNINNHAGQSSMLIIVGLDSDAGGSGLSLFRYHKDTDKLEALGAAFAGTSVPTNVTGEDIYFSGTRPSTVYVAQGSQLLRVDVLSKTEEVVFDAASRYGSGTYLWQHHSSDDDRVHSASLRVSDTGATLGCLVYREDTAAFQLYEPKGDFDECQVDRSGDWLVIKDNIDGTSGEDNRIINLKTLAETDLMDENGAAGHSDMGYGLLVAEDNWNNLPGAVRAWGLGQSPMLGPVVYHDSAWRTEGSSHVSHTNARPGLAADQQMACESTVARSQVNRGSEIFCYRLDGSLDVMVVAPVMTDLDAAGGGDDYAKAPKGNLDVTGRYFIWTSNAGGNRLDAFLVKVPSLLVE